MNSIIRVKLLLWLLCLLPLGVLAWRIGLETVGAQPVLGANPGEAVLEYLGIWSLRMLLVAYAVSPLATLLRWNGLRRSRRLLGLFAFAYVTLHLIAYLVFYTGLSWSAFVQEFAERVYIAAGVLAWSLLLAMAFTSTRGWQRRLGRYWRALHRVVHVAVLAGVAHFVWQTKDGISEVVPYVLVALILVVLRMYVRIRRSRIDKQGNRVSHEQSVSLGR